jgi:hypothetical protein
MRGKRYSKSSSIAVVLFLIIAAVYFFSQGPDLTQYESLKTPRITNMATQKMIVVVAQGDPNRVAKDAFGLLFKTYYRIPGVSKKMKQAPRARWTGDVKDKSSWTGYYGLPVPADVAALPEQDGATGLKAELATWEYGDVAEILHIGPYGEETPAIEKLHEFIRQHGYEIIGPHEEEYVKGPGMFFKGDPKNYYTIIRYRIRKRA